LAPVFLIRVHTYVVTIYLWNGCSNKSLSTVPWFYLLSFFSFLFSSNSLIERWQTHKSINKIMLPLNYNFIFACVYMRGTTRKLQCHPVTCLRRLHFLVACNVHVTCRNTHGTKVTHMKQKIHTRTFTHVNYSPDILEARSIIYLTNIVCVVDYHTNIR